MYAVLSTPRQFDHAVQQFLLMAAICKAFFHRCHSSCSSRLLPLPSPPHLTKQQHACRVLAASFQGRRPADGEQCDCLEKFAQLLGCSRSSKRPYAPPERLAILRKAISAMASRPSWNAKIGVFSFPSSTACRLHKRSEIVPRRARRRRLQTRERRPWPSASHASCGTGRG